MSNYATTKIKFQSEISPVLDFMKSETRFFDFNNLDPVPLSDESTTKEWKLANWGSRSNSYDVIVSQDSITFDTQLFYPDKLLEKLIQKFSISCEVFSKDENDSSYVCRKYENGLLVEDYDFNLSVKDKVDRELEST